MNKENSFKCPLCCGESFDCANTLKEHILSVLRNLKCPFCSLYIAEISVLAVHLQECRKIPKSKAKQKTAKKEKISILKEENSPVPVLEVEDENVNIEERDEDFKSEFPELGKDQEYYCEICNVHFLEMKKHLTEYHLGQEVVVETDNALGDSETQPEIFKQDEQATSMETEQIFLEQEVLDEEGKFYTKKLTKINIIPAVPTKSPPLIEHLVFLDGASPTVVEKDADISIENSMKVFKCETCNLRFAQRANFNKHECNSLQGEICEICTIHFTTKGALTSHRRKLHGEEKPLCVKIPTECDLCRIVFPSEKSMIMHRKMHDPITKPKKIDAPANYDIDGMKIAEESDEKFTCGICGNEYYTGYEEIHMKSHLETLFNCAICNRKFENKADLIMHAQAHGTEIDKKFSCGFCKKLFTNEASLKDHMENDCQKAKKYSCNFCGRRFQRPHEKVKHERIHTGHKPHVCEICGKGFRVSYCLSLHLRTHSGVRPYHCDKCGKRFKSHSVFAHHMQTHSDLRPYKCPYCPKAFKTSVQLAGHRNTHTKPFSCDICNRPFASLYNLRLHIKSHERKNNFAYQCHICGAIYARKFALRDHILTHSECTPGLELSLEEVEVECEEENSMDSADYQNTEENA